MTNVPTAPTQEAEFRRWQFNDSVKVIRGPYSQHVGKVFADRGSKVALAIPGFCFDKKPIIFDKINCKRL